MQERGGTCRNKVCLISVPLFRKYLALSIITIIYPICHAGTRCIPIPGYAERPNRPSRP